MFNPKKELQQLIAGLQGIAETLEETARVIDQQGERLSALEAKDRELRKAIDDLAIHVGSRIGDLDKKLEGLRTHTLLP